MADFVRERMALSAQPCLETYKTAKPAIHGRSVYNLYRPLTAKQPAQIHAGPLRGGEEQSNYILKQQSEAGLACKHTASTHTNTDRFKHEKYICSRVCSLIKDPLRMCLACLVFNLYFGVAQTPNCWHERHIFLYKSEKQNTVSKSLQGGSMIFMFM